MTRIVVLIGASVGGAAGWWLGERFGILAALFSSLVGTAVGVYYSRKWGSNHFG